MSYCYFHSIQDLQSVKKCLAKGKKISEIRQDQKTLISAFCISFDGYCQKLFFGREN